MRQLEFRGDLLTEAQAVFEFRELIRGRKHHAMPSGPDGLVVEDLDLVLRWHGPKPLYPHLDAIGRFRLVELKRGNAPLGYSKESTFGLIDRSLAESERYDGYYVVRASDDDHDLNTTYTISGVTLDCREFLAWCMSPYSNIPRTSL